MTPIEEEPTDAQRAKDFKSNIKQKFLSTSRIWKMAAISSLLGFSFHVISFGSPFWIVVQGVTNSSFIGIWSTCTTMTTCSFRSDDTDCLLAVRVFHGLGVVCGVAIILITILYVISENSRKCKAISSIVASFISALCIQIGTGIFGRSRGCDDTLDLNDSKWAWSLALSVTSVVLYCVCIFFLVIDQLRQCAHTGKQKDMNGRNLGLNIT